MTRLGKDLTAGLLTVLAVLVYATTHEGWNAYLIGGSHRWAAGAIGILGLGCCALGSRKKTAMTPVLMLLGIAALALFVVAVVTGSLTPLSLLVAAIVLLFLVSTFEHVGEVRHRPVLH
jgi:hypothetical protein